MFKIEEVKSKLESAVSGLKLKTARDYIVLENAEDITKVAKHLKTSSDFQMDYLSSVTGADYLSFLELIYHFYSMTNKTGPITIKARVKRENPKLPSLVALYRGAEFQEREIYDMYGIEFEGHPDLRRIFMWDGFQGYPMRKDYEQENSEILEADDIAWLEKHGIPVSGDAKAQAEELKAQGKRAVASKELKDKAK